MVAITEPKGPDLKTSETLTRPHRVDSCVEQAVRQRLEACSYRFVYSKVTWQYADGTLTLSGCVPSFYLKQVLQELLRDVEQIDCVANNVQVVSADGLSSETASEPS